jgi:hypothetical protein
MAHEIGFYQMISNGVRLISRHARGFKEGSPKSAEGGMLNGWHDWSSFYFRWMNGFVALPSQWRMSPLGKLCLL